MEYEKELEVENETNHKRANELEGINDRLVKEYEKLQ